ncbi:MAG: TonB-dependent receptor [Bacteroidota bacterium]
MKLRLFINIVLELLIITHKLPAQNQDSIKTYRLGEVTIKGMLELEPESFILLDKSLIIKSDAASVAELGRKVPSLKVQTNSRGESLFYFRGNGERQLTLFFDGVPMNIPWDNRVDLSLVPSSAVGDVTILKGIPPSIFGPNAIAGVINISSKRIEFEEGRLAIHLSENNKKSLSGSWQDKFDNISLLLSASYNKSDGYDLPENFEDSSNPGKLRLNSYLESKSIFGKLGYNSDMIDGNIFISFIDSKKGVPPEIGIENPRYWQYPLWQNITAAASGNLKLDSAHSNIFYSISLTQFKMQINQFADPGYLYIDDTEKNWDDTFRGRLIYTNILSSNSLIKIALNYQSSIHKEEFLSGNFVSSTYSENIISLGAEYEYIQDKYVLSLGGGYDWITTPKTGDKESKEGNSDYSLNAAFVYKLGDDLSVRFNVGRKTRFPTLRETFSGALGRFVPNPNLKAESAASGEISFNYKDYFFTGDASFFLSYLGDGVVRVTLPERKFQRINKDKVRTYGVEFAGSYKPDDRYSINFNFTYLNSFAKSNGDYTDTLEYKPKYSSSLFIDYPLTDNFNVLTELEYLGWEFGLKEGTAGFQKLPDYFLLNVRVSYQFIFGNGYELEFFIRANNILDRLYYTQIGLPEAGRQYFFGMNLLL